MKGLVCLLLLLETFVFVEGGLNENDISQQLRSEDRRQNPPQTDTLRAEASNEGQEDCHLCFPDIYAALTELTATVTEQKENIRELKENIRELTDTVTEQKENIRELKENIRELTNTVTEQKENIRELTTTVTEQKENIRELTDTVTEQKENIRELTAMVTEQNENIKALETRLRDEINKKTEEMYDLILSQIEELRQENKDSAIAFSAGQPGYGYVGPFTTEITLTYKNVFTNIGNAYNPITGIFTAPLKGAYMFRVSVYGHGGIAATAVIFKNGELIVLAHADQTQLAINSSNGVVLLLEVGDVVYVRLQTGRRIIDNGNNHNTFSGFLLFPL